jgi:DMSO/TMAO reductase YedYZ heme-binding membrane subunit
MPAGLQETRIITIVAMILGAALLSTYSQAGGYVSMLPLVMVPTAHAAFLLFWMAFTASAIRQLAPGSYGRWAMRNRRHIGLSFALVHGVHGLLVLSNLALTEASRPLPVLLVGGTAYAFLIAMTLTSTNAAVRRLGAKRWKRLHKMGSYYIWFIFMATTLPPAPHNAWVGAMGVVALALRITAHRRRKARPKGAGDT